MESSPPWIIKWLSAPRWQTYINAAHQDPHLALELYEWSVELAGALMHDIAHFEIALRNRFCAAIESNWDGQQHWLLDPKSPVRKENQRLTFIEKAQSKQAVDLNARNRQRIDEVIRRLPSANPTPDSIIAELPLGFWKHMTARGQEQNLWIPYIYYAFPRGTSRSNVFEALSHINTLRNRVAHHEPLVSEASAQQIAQCQKLIRDLLGMLLPELAEYISRTSKVKKLMDERPLGGSRTE
ncbi:MAG: Abi family protein [Corynebacterium sp.]|nr:Abi family protein [Corynebacterium sp.]